MAEAAAASSKMKDLNFFQLLLMFQGFWEATQQLLVM
jgi:hypothetical protein